MKNEFLSTKPPAQKVWDYAKDKVLFRIEDVLIITDINPQTLKTLIWSLTKANYIKLEKKSTKYEDRVYRLIKDTGEIVPKLRGDIVYDANTKESIDIKGKGVKEIMRELEGKVEKLKSQKVKQKPSVVEDLDKTLIKLREVMKDIEKYIN